MESTKKHRVHSSWLCGSLFHTSWTCQMNKERYQSTVRLRTHVLFTHHNTLLFYHHTLINKMALRVNISDLWSVVITAIISCTRMNEHHEHHRISVLQLYSQPVMLCWWLLLLLFLCYSKTIFVLFCCMTDAFHLNGLNVVVLTNKVILDWSSQQIHISLMEFYISQHSNEIFLFGKAVLTNLNWWKYRILRW